jgi:hypothetical protein
MANVNELENMVSNLPPEDYKQFRDWFEKYENERWDLQFEKDVESGKLDSHAQEAIQEYKSGKYSDL